MLDYVELGPSPSDEDCAQVGDVNYYDRASQELREFRRMMVNLHPPIFATAYQIKTFDHDFGVYRELVAVYQNDDDAIEWAYQAEALVPPHWDQRARLNLGLA